MFASRTITVHLARGAAGVGAIAGAVAMSGSYPLVWLIALPVALVAFRGCPICWAAGFVETVAAKVRRGGGRCCGQDTLTGRRAPDTR